MDTDCSGAAVGNRFRGNRKKHIKIQGCSESILLPEQPFVIIR